MKIDRIVILLMSLLFMVACAEQEDDFLSNPQDDGKLRLYIAYPEGEQSDSSTRAGTDTPTDPINDSNPDNRVSSMRVMAFRMSEDGKKRFDKTLTVDKDNTNPSVPIEVPEGEYVFVVVCNQDADPDLAAKLTNVTNYQALRTVQVKGDAFGNGKDIIMVGDSSDPTYDKDGNLIPGGLITINEDGLTAHGNKFTVRVMRLASRLRFTVYTKRHNETAGEKKVPELTKLELAHLPGTMGIKGSNHAYDPTTTISLDGGIVSVADLTDDEKGKNYVTKQTIGRMIIPSSVTFSRENGAIVRAYFGAEDTEGAVVLEGVISYKPNGGGQQMYLLNPNAQYHVTLAASPDNLKVAAEVEDWTVENLVGNVGKTYELEGGETYIPYSHGLWGKDYQPINAVNTCDIKVKFLVNAPPYQFTLINEELGISQLVTMENNSDVISVNIDASDIHKKYNASGGNDPEAAKASREFWGLEIGTGYKYTQFSRSKKLTFRIDNITAANGTIQLPAIDYLPECEAISKINFVSCGFSVDGYYVTSYAHTTKGVGTVDDPIEFILSQENHHFPTADSKQEAADYCKKLGPGWNLANRREGEALVDPNRFKDPLRYFIPYGWGVIGGNSINAVAPFKMYGWFDGLGGDYELVSQEVTLGSYTPNEGVWVFYSELFKENTMFTSADVGNVPKHPICVRDLRKYPPYSLSASTSYVGVNLLIIDPAGKPYRSNNEIVTNVTNYGGEPVSHKRTYSYDIKTTVTNLQNSTVLSSTSDKISTTESRTTHTFKEINKPEYWTADNWAGDAGGRGTQFTVEVSNPVCNGVAGTITAGTGVQKINVKRMQAYKTKDGKYYVEMDRNGQIETLHTPESAFGYTIPNPKKDHQVSDFALDGRPICERKYGAGWMAAGTDIPIIYLKELNEAGVLRPGRLYYTNGVFHDQFWRWEKTWFGQLQVWYVRVFISAFDTNGFNDMQKDMPSSTWGYVHGMPHARGYVLCVKQIGR